MRTPILFSWFTMSATLHPFLSSGLYEDQPILRLKLDPPSPSKALREGGVDGVEEVGGLEGNQ